MKKSIRVNIKKSGGWENATSKFSEMMIPGDVALFVQNSGSGEITIAKFIKVKDDLFQFISKKGEIILADSTLTSAFEKMATSLAKERFNISQKYPCMKEKNTMKVCLDDFFNCGSFVLK